MQPLRQSQADESHAGISPGMTFLFSVAGAAAVGNLYWAQPILGAIARALRISLAESGALMTVTQLGYACGVLLLVPLGDSVNRRRLVPSLMTVSAISLVGAALSTDHWVLMCALAFVGLTSLSGQLLLPLAGDMARSDQRGKVIGTIASGLLAGIMLSRLISGIVTDSFGWQSTFMLAAALNILFAFLLFKWLPDDQPRPAISYGKLLWSIAEAVYGSRPVQATIALGACAFAVFTMFWTGLTFLLSSPPFSYSATEIGLLNLIGLIGALGAKSAGRLHDSKQSTEGTGLALGLTLIALGLAAAGRSNIVVILMATLLLNLAIQAQNVLNQTRLLTIRPELRSRLNTAFIVCNFIAGAGGSIFASYLWERGGWLALSAGQVAIALFATITWAVARRNLKSIETRVV